MTMTAIREFFGPGGSVFIDIETGNIIEPEKELVNNDTTTN